MGCTIAKITEQPIDLNSIYTSLAHTGYGAQLLFVGSVRDTNNGRDVQGISYEAHAQLAQNVFQELAREAEQIASSALSVAIVHRIGTLKIGELCTVIGVAAPHREAAYLASRYIIEQLKLRAPIWKEEHYVTGDSTWLDGASLTDSIDRVTTRPLGVVILAGGRSSRMGQNKALMFSESGESKTLLEHSLLLGSAILKRYGGDDEDLYVSGEYPNVRCIPDILPNRGPVGGIHSSVTFALANTTQYQNLLFIPVDMPGVSVELLISLLSFGLREQTGGVFAHSPLPLLLPVNSATLTQIGALLHDSKDDEREISVRELCRNLNVPTFESAHGANALFVNLNTPEEYAGWISGARHEPTNS